MTSKKERDLAFGLAIVLFIVGIVSYAAFSASPPEQPVRRMFKTLGGKVLFDHKTHAAESGYGLACSDCHHHPEGDEAANRACGDCHRISDEVNNSKVCLECHEEGDVDASEVMKRSDAFHKQCAGCHEENDSGPKGKDCSSCHMMNR